ncbi:MAG: hypothetical protein R6W76_08905, partial [Caldilinea sp.]
MQQEQMITQTQPTAIDWRRLGLRLLFTLILPVTIAFLFDQWLGTSPFLAMAIGLICIPVATFAVIRMALTELDRVIAEVAPLEQQFDEDVEVSIAANGNGAPTA